MTCAQIPDRLLFDDETLAMDALPLAPWLAREQLVAPAARADCVRGYVGTWRLHGARLCLVAIEPACEGLCLQRERDERPLEVSLQALHGSVRPVWADWFSGRLRCPQLPCVRYSEFGIPHAAQHDLVIDVAAGRVQRIGFEARDAASASDTGVAVAGAMPAAPRVRWPWPLPAWRPARGWYLLPQRPAH